MREACKVLRQSLILYAEGELADPIVNRRVRRHLSRCGGCREFLEKYDRGTRELLESYGLPGAEVGRFGGAAGFDAHTGSYDGFLGSETGRFDLADVSTRSPERAARIFAAIDAEVEPPTESVAPGVVVDDRRRSSHRLTFEVPSASAPVEGAGWTRRAMSSAALLALSLVLYLVFLSGEPGRDTGDSLSSSVLAGDSEPVDRFESSPASARWVIDDAWERPAASREVAPATDVSDRELRLVSVSSQESSFVVDVLVDTPPPSSGYGLYSLRRSGVSPRFADQLLLVLESDLVRLRSDSASERVRRQVWSRARRLTPVVVSEADDWERRRAQRYARATGNVYRVVAVPPRAALNLADVLAAEFLDELERDFARRRLRELLPPAAKVRLEPSLQFSTEGLRQY